MPRGPDSVDDCINPPVLNLWLVEARDNDTATGSISCVQSDNESKVDRHKGLMVFPVVGCKTPMKESLPLAFKAAGLMVPEPSLMLPIPFKVCVGWRVGG